MKYLKKYSLLLVGILVFLLACKSCQSCSRARTIEYNKSVYENIEDSLNSVIRHQHDSIIALTNDINILLERTNGLDARLQDVTNLNNQLNSTNNKLINHINKNNERP